MTFKERAKLATEILSKQEPITLEKARAQALRIKIRSTRKSKEQKDQEIKELLKIYHPDWTQEQIDAELVQLYRNNEKYHNNKP